MSMSKYQILRRFLDTGKKGFSVRLLRKHDYEGFLFRFVNRYQSQFPWNGRKYSSDEDDFVGNGGKNDNKWKLELAWLPKALEPAFQLYKWALPAVEEEDLAFKAAKETLESSLLFLKRKEQNSWLASIEDHIYESNEPVYLELHATAILCQPSGDCMCPNATLLTPLMSALYSSVSEEEVLKRKLMVRHCDGGIVQVHERGWLGTRKWNFRKSANLSG